MKSGRMLRVFIAVHVCSFLLSFDAAAGSLETTSRYIMNEAKRGVLHHYRFKLMYNPDSKNILVRLGGTPTIIDQYIDRTGRLRICGIFIRTPAYYQCV